MGRSPYAFLSSLTSIDKPNSPLTVTCNSPMSSGYLVQVTLQVLSRSASVGSAGARQVGGHEAEHT